MAKTTELTDEQKQIINYHANGFSAPEIGSAMGLSPRTVEGKTLELCKQLNVRNKTHLVSLALRKTLIEFKEKKVK